MDLRGGNDTVDIEGTVVGCNVSVARGDGQDTVNIGDATHNYNAIQGNVTITPGAGIDNLNVYDQANGNNTYTVTSGSFGRSGAATVTYSGMNTVTINGGGTALPNVYNVNSTEGFFTTALNANTPGDTINVAATGLAGALNIDTATNSTINIGAAGSVQQIQGEVHVNNAGIDTDTLTIDDSRDPGGHTVWVEDQQILYLAPAFITYTQYSLAKLNITGGQGGTVWNVPNTEPSILYLGGNNQLIRGTLTTTLTAAGIDTVNVGANGSAQSIQGDLTVDSNPVDAVTLVIDDSRNAGAYTAIITHTSIQGMTPGMIRFGEHALSNLNLDGSTGGDTWDIQSTEAPVNIIQFHFDTTTTLTANGNDTVNVGYQISTPAGRSRSTDGRSAGAPGLDVPYRSRTNARHSFPSLWIPYSWDQRTWRSLR